MAEKTESAKGEASSGRGQSYPFIDLQEAVQRARKFYEEEGKAPAAVAAAVRHWGYSDKSSGGRQTVATLLQFGLFKSDGYAEQRRVSLSKLALDILLLESGSKEQTDALKTAAQTPKIYAQILSHYATTGLPSDGSLKHYLLTELDVSTAGVDLVIRNFRATYRYANLCSSDKIQAGTASAVQNVRNAGKEPEVGDLVQWESGGVLQFSEPRRVRAVQEHEGSKWVFVDGSETGVPIAEVKVEQVAATPVGQMAKSPPTLTETKVASEREWLRGPLSKESSYRLIVTGDLGAKEIGKLIKLLEAQKEVLDDSD